MRKNFLLIITLALMCWGLFGTWAQGGRGPNISFLKNPWITGPSGVYTKYTNQEGGVRWSPSKSDPSVAIQSEASGFGDVTSTLTDITIAGNTFSVSGSGTSIGSMQVVYGWPFSAESPWSYSSHGKSISFIETPGTYKWSASGNVKLTPYVWEWDLGSGENFTGDWVKKPELAENEGALQTSGEWSVVHKAECIECKVTADTVADLSPDHDKVLCAAPNCNETYRKCAPGTHTSTPCPIFVTGSDGLPSYCTIPAWGCQPHNTHHFNTSSNNGNSGNSGGSSSGCANNEEYNYCDDQGSCSEGSTSGVPGPVCGHNYCCCSPSSDSGSGSGSGSGGRNCGTCDRYYAPGEALLLSCPDSAYADLCWFDDSSSGGGSGSSDTGNSGNTAICSAGHTYNSNSSSAVNRHRTRTCRRSGCGQSWQACVDGWNAPACPSPYGDSCWAQ